MSTSAAGEIARYERARRLANIAMFAIDLQVRRLSSVEPEDGRFLFRKWFDFDMLVVALTRLRRAAGLAASVPQIKAPLTSALNEFDSALPNIKRFRDVAEHFDDYALDRGRLRAVGRNDLEVSSIEGETLEWLGCQLTVSASLTAASRLLEAVLAAAVTPELTLSIDAGTHAASASAG